MKTLKNIYTEIKTKWASFEKFMEPYGKAAAYSIHR